MVCGLRFCEFPCFIKNGTFSVFLPCFVFRCFRKISGWRGREEGSKTSLFSLSEDICDVRASNVSPSCALVGTGPRARSHTGSSDSAEGSVRATFRVVLSSVVLSGVMEGTVRNCPDAAALPPRISFPFVNSRCLCAFPTSFLGGRGTHCMDTSFFVSPSAADERLPRARTLPNCRSSYTAAYP